MRLFRRIGDIVAANLNDLVDRFEDPEVMLKQAIREMETMIEQATAAAARAIAAERLLARDLVDHQEKAGRWQARAEEAVRTGDDDLGRQAIARGLEHQAILLTLAEQQSSAERTAQALRDQILAMRAKQAEARRKLASLSSRRQMVDVGRALRGSTCTSANGANGFARSNRCPGRSTRLTRRPRLWSNSTTLPNRVGNQTPNRASKPSASRPSSPRSRSGFGPRSNRADGGKTEPRPRGVTQAL